MEKNTDVIDSIGTGSVMVDADSSFETAPDRHPSTEEASARIESVNADTATNSGGEERSALGGQFSDDMDISFLDENNEIFLPTYPYIIYRLYDHGVSLISQGLLRCLQKFHEAVYDVTDI